MQRSWMATMVVLALVAIMVFAAPAPSAASGRTGDAAMPPSGHANSGFASHLSTAAAPTPLITFPRTVLIEAFTGVWCPHCPAETQALHYIEQSTPAGIITVPELHVCEISVTQCYDNYVPPDNTTNSRGAFYNVCGFPDVYFDGTHSVCGATDYVSQMQPNYEDHIANASKFPGNVSISQTSEVVGSTVVDWANVTSGVTGSYNAVTYLLETINKMNVSIGAGPHDIDEVVRSTLHNQPVSLVAGETTPVVSRGNLLPNWNTLNLSVVTLIQQNSTKYVQNANEVPVTTLSTTLVSSSSTLISGTTSTITLRVTNSTTGVALSGAAVTLSADLGGTFSPASGVTASDGSFTSTYTAPSVTSSENVVVTASVSAAGYTSGSASASLVVTPVVLPLAPSGLAVVGGNATVVLNWTAPSGGGAGLSYDVYRAPASSGPFAQIGVATLPTYTDLNLIGGQSYWYKVDAKNSFGYSTNTSLISITGVSASTQGIPLNVGWWITINSVKYSSDTNGALYVFLPAGFYQYTFGPGSYAYLASGGSGTLTASGSSLTIAASFTPRYANLQGSVDPAGASVVLNGTPLAVSDGTFSAVMAAGSYSLSVSAPGYADNNTTVILTPGNLTTVLVQLTSTGGSSTASQGGLTTTDDLIIVVGVVAVVALVGAALVMSSGRSRRSGRRPPRGPTPPPPETE
ncbi:MAG TPA: PEGA domain-containing protein [Thermoplasmata archaeon]|nr:PEGA domain-containing protein [Thermoplasmata archaeon]